MNLNITIITQNGSVYELQQRNNRLYIQRDTTLSGEVVKLNGDIRIGNTLKVDFIRDNIYCTPESQPDFLHTSPVVQIMIRQ